MKTSLLRQICKFQDPPDIQPPGKPRSRSPEGKYQLCAYWSGWRPVQPVSKIRSPLWSPQLAHKTIIPSPLLLSLRRFHNKPMVAGVSVNPTDSDTRRHWPMLTTCPFSHMLYSKQIIFGVAIAGVSAAAVKWLCIFDTSFVWLFVAAHKLARLWTTPVCSFVSDCLWNILKIRSFSEFMFSKLINLPYNLRQSSSLRNTTFWSVAHV